MSSAAAQDGTRQETDATAPGTAAASTPRVGDPEGCGAGMSHAGPDESSGATAFPEGWQLGIESWAFHRQFFVRVGRPTAHREYTALRGKIRNRTAESLGGPYFRVTLVDGAPIVIRGGWTHLSGVEAGDWTPPSKPARKAAAKVAAPAPSAPEPKPQAPPPAAPVARRPLRASTLTLGNPAAARVLAERLRRSGIPEHVIGQASA